jgi:branched-chain amino acid transport system substrate-binding protein
MANLPMLRRHCNRAGAIKREETLRKRHYAVIGAFIAALAGPGPLAAQGKDTVKIGVLADLAGTSADIGGPGSVAAAEMAVKDFGGTVAGKKIVVVSADHQAKPDLGSAIAQKWYDVDGVDVIIDVPVSSVALAVQQVANQRKKLLMVTAATVADLTGRHCSPFTLHWSDDTNALAEGTPLAVTKAGGDTWFFVSADFVFGRTLQEAAAKVIAANGGKVLGGVKAPLNTPDFASFLLQAQASKAKIIGLNVVGTDFINAVKQASEFGLVAGGQKLVGFLVYVSDIHSLGLKASQGLQITESFYWDANEESRAFAKKFQAVRKVMPTKVHAANYAAVTHYLNAVKATNSTDAEKTVPWMKANKTEYFGQKVDIRADGRVMFDLALYEVKAPGDSKDPWDYYKRLGTLKGENAFHAISDKCQFPAKVQ